MPATTDDLFSPVSEVAKSSQEDSCCTSTDQRPEDAASVADLLPQCNDFDVDAFFAKLDEPAPDYTSSNFPVDTTLPFEAGESSLFTPKAQSPAQLELFDFPSDDEPFSLDWVDFSDFTGPDYFIPDEVSQEETSIPTTEGSSTCIDPQLYTSTADGCTKPLLLQNFYSTNTSLPQHNQTLYNPNDCTNTFTSIGLFGNEEQENADQNTLLFQSVPGPLQQTDEAPILDIPKEVTFSDTINGMQQVFEEQNGFPTAQSGLLASDGFHDACNGDMSDVFAQLEREYTAGGFNVDNWFEQEYGIDQRNSFAPYFNEAPTFPPPGLDSWGIQPDEILNSLSYSYPAPPTDNIAPQPTTMTALPAPESMFQDVDPMFSAIFSSSSTTAAFSAPTPNRKRKQLDEAAPPTAAAKRVCLQPHNTLVYYGPRVSSDRKSKRMKDASTDPENIYTRRQQQQLDPWGPTAADGFPLFSYQFAGELSALREYKAYEIQHYIANCPRPLTLWLQQAPSQSNHRLVEIDRKCRYAQCPVKNRKIHPGWLRIAFDEFSQETTSGERDPYKVAMVMHLWCFEQCCDPLEVYLSGMLLPENRVFPREVKNTMALTKNYDSMIIGEAFEPWQQRQQAAWESQGYKQFPRPHADSLSYTMVKYHLDHQIASRQATRESRNSVRSREQWNTMDVHMGDLAEYARRADMPRRMQRKGRGRNIRGKSTSSTDYSSREGSSSSSHDEGTNTTSTSQSGCLTPLVYK